MTLLINLFNFSRVHETFLTHILSPSFLPIKTEGYLTWVHFSPESWFDDFFRDCADTLTVYDGGSWSSPMIGNYSYCTSIPNLLITSSNEAFIHFQTNQENTDIGFKLKYKAIINWKSRPFYVIGKKSINWSFKNCYC